MAWARRSGGARRLAVARLPRKTAPTATPPTSVPVRNKATFAALSEATIRASPTRNRPRPASTTWRAGSRKAASWVTVPAANIANTTAPATAWLLTCMMLPRKVGASALNSPSRLKAENPAAMAARNSLRPRSGRPRPVKRRAGRRRGLTVSGTMARLSAATASTPRYTSKTKVVGCGAYCANSPATRGPRPSPPMFAAVAASEARRPAVHSSVSAAVAVPVIRPADSPDRTRPTPSAATSPARMITTVLTALRPSATASTGLRPA